MKKISIVLILVILLTGCSNQGINLEQASVVEGNLRSFNLKYPVVDDFDGYFQYPTEDNQKVPVLVHVTFKYNDHEYNRISDVISGLNVSILGIAGEVNVSESYNDADAFSQMIHVKHQSGNIVTSTAQTPGVAYLKKNFTDQVTILDYDDEMITYAIEDSIDSCFFALRFTHDEQNNRIVLELDN